MKTKKGINGKEIALDTFLIVFTLFIFYIAINPHH